MAQKYLYVVFSATPYRIGRLIRNLTGETYNHISLSLDKDLRRMYSFSRRFYRTPFYGGFVWESPSRYQVNGHDSQICLCALPVTDSQHKQLEQLVEAMYSKRQSYLYNHLSVLGTVIRKPIPVKDAYTCVEFCIRILRDMGVDVHPGKYYTIGDVQKLLQPYTVYSGNMPKDATEDTAFFSHSPVPHPVITTLRDILRLFPRWAYK